MTFPDREGREVLCTQRPRRIQPVHSPANTTPGAFATVQLLAEKAPAGAQRKTWTMMQAGHLVWAAAAATKHIAFS